jgi:hypothetical protein
MASQADVRRIALALPDTVESSERFAFSVLQQGGKTKPQASGIAWVWMERTHPKKPRVANPAVLAVRVDGLSARDMLLASDAKKYFTEPHYAGFPAVLVRLAEVKVAELRELLTEAWRCRAPKELVEAFDRRPRRR